MIIPLCTHLSEHWLIHLIMAVFPVADQVNHDILVEGLSPLCSHLTHMNNSLWVIGIHMEDGSRYHLCMCVCTFCDMVSNGAFLGSLLWSTDCWL